MKIVYHNGMFSISSDNIYFSLIEDMYKGNRAGVGLQVNDESKRTETEKLCLDLYLLIKENKDLI